MFRSRGPTSIATPATPATPLGDRAVNASSPLAGSTPYNPPPSVLQHGGTRRGRGKFPFRLNMYAVPPMPGEEVELDAFESWGLDRLRVLAEIEGCQVRTRNHADLAVHMQPILERWLPLSANTSQSADHLTEREKDNASHFVLRLAFCRSPELRRRFVKVESALFRLRYESDDAREREAFLDSLQLDWERVSDGEKERLKDALQAASPRTRKTWATERFYKVPWIKVADLVERRRVLLMGGMAYVPSAEQASLVFAEFSSRLEHDMEVLSLHIPRRVEIDEDTRLVPILEHLSMSFMVGMTVGPGAAEGHALFGDDAEARITWDMVEPLVRRHGPMCMRNMQEELNKNHKLKHYGRLEYNLFLKEMGLPIEEALVFWRKMFSTTSDDTFNKEYRYNIRHGYGLEGSKKSYPAYSCAKILTQNPPGPSETHGCPYRTMPPAMLQQRLREWYGIQPGDAGEILKAAQGGHYHIACTRVFELTHRSKKRGGVKRGEGIGPNAETVTHPNRYVERSYIMEREAGEQKQEGETLGSDVEEDPPRRRIKDEEEDDKLLPQPQAVAVKAEPMDEDEQPFPLSQSDFGDDDPFSQLSEDDLVAIEQAAAATAAKAASSKATQSEGHRSEARIHDKAASSERGTSEHEPSSHEEDASDQEGESDADRTIQLNAPSLPVDEAPDEDEAMGEA